MLKLLATFLLPLTLSVALMSCDSPVKKDGYSFEGGSTRLPDLTITVVTHLDAADLQRAFNATHSTAADGVELQAFSIIKLGNRTCEIHVLDPASNYVPEFMGHELAHCLYGQWHPTQKGGAV